MAQKKQLLTKLYARNSIYQLAWKPFGGEWEYRSLGTRDPEKAKRERQKLIDNYVPDRRDEIAILKAKLARLEGEQLREEAQAALHIDNVWKAFMESTDTEPIQHATLQGYASYWKGKTGLKPFMERRGIATLADFGSEDAGEFIKYLAAEGIGKATATKYLTFFRRLWDTIAPRIENPWKRKKAQGFGGKVGKRPFTLDHQSQIIHDTGRYFEHADYMPPQEREQASIEYKALHIIMAYTGLRLVDACMLTLEEVFFGRGVIELAPQKTRFRGDDPMYAKIGIHPVLGVVLRTLMLGRTSGYFLCHIASEYQRDKSAVSKHIQQQIHTATELACCVRAPGRKRAIAVYGAHSHRKALSDRMREAGIDIMVRLQILGHKDSRSEAQDYSHVSDQEVRDAIMKSMPDLLRNHSASSISQI